MQPLPDHRYAIFAMADGPEAPPVCEADTTNGACLAVVCLANEGAPGWYTIVDRGEAVTPASRVRTYHAPEGVTVTSLHAVPAHRPWIEAAR